MTKIAASTFVGALMLAALPSTPATAAASQSAACANAAGTAAAKPKKKRGFGLGGLLKAANQAGVGNMLGYGGMLGNGQMGQVAGAIAGTAVNAAGGSADAQGSAGHIGGLIGGSRAGQIAGAVTGTASNLARTMPKGDGTATPAATCQAGAVDAYLVNGKLASLQPLKRLQVKLERSAPGRDGRTEVVATFRNPNKDIEMLTAAGYRLMGPNSQGSFVTARYALYSASGVRDDNQPLPIPYRVGPGAEVQVRYVFEDAPVGDLTITDGDASHVFTPAN
jgi:hypothetical protein